MKNISFIFDIDDTLYSQMEPLQNACEASLGRPLPDPEEFYQTFSVRSGEMFLFSESGKVSIEESRLYRIENTMKDLNIPFTHEMAVDFQKRYQENQSRLSVSESLSRILDTCKRLEIPMGVITNGPFTHQMNKCRTLKLERWFCDDQILVSAAVGVAKPDIGIFQMAQKRLNLNPETTYMIGDSYKNDIMGAIGAGWKTIWMNHHHYPVPVNVPDPDFIAYTDEELAGIIGNLIL